LTAAKSDWTYQGNEFTSEMIGESFGFVYRITDLSNGKKYIGKKWFWSTTKRPPLKGYKRKRTVVKESDWIKYFGSSDEVKALVEQNGYDGFEREILKLCANKGECTYWETKLHFEYDVLLDDNYYNAFVSCKIHAKHVSSLKKD